MLKLYYKRTTNRRCHTDQGVETQSGRVVHKFYPHRVLQGRATDGEEFACSGCTVNVIPRTAAATLIRGGDAIRVLQCAQDVVWAVQKLDLYHLLN